MDKNIATNENEDFVNDLIAKGIVVLNFYKTNPKHALEYGIEAKNPIYVQNLHVAENKREKGIGKKVLKYIEEYAIKNGHDVIFGHVASKSSFSKDPSQTVEADDQLLKDWLSKNRYTVNNENNDFYKLILIAPNGKPSNLSPEQYKLVRTPEFKAWFGDWESEYILNEISNPNTAIKFIDNLLPIKSDRVLNFPLVQRLMLGLAHNDEVLGSIVSFLPVNVMNSITGQNIPTNKISSNLSVFSHALNSPISNNNVLSLEQAVARFTTKLSDFFNRRSNQIHFATLNTKDLTLFVIGGLSAFESVTYFNGGNRDVKLSRAISATKPLLPKGLRGKNNATKFTSLFDNYLLSSHNKNYYDKHNKKLLVSQVKDENGEPLVCFHGTDVEFYEFKKTDKSRWDVFWFSPNFDSAKMYSETKDETNTKTPKVLPCFLNVRKPSKKYPFNLEEYDGYIDYLTRMDYASFKSTNTIQVVQVVKSTQIKLADGTNKTFNKLNPDIRFNGGGGVPTLLAPNGKPSNLNPEQYKLVRSDFFKAFFGDWEKLALTKINDSGIDEVSLKRLEDGVSKAVDENGEPLVVFHATTHDFNVFSNDEDTKRRGVSKEGIFFTDSISVSETYIYKNLTPTPKQIKSGFFFKENANIMPVFLSLQNPLIVDAGFTNFSSIGEKHKHINDFISIAKKHNKDGLIVKNVKDLGSAVDFLKDELFATTYIVFKPNQIKSAIGNNGNFDTNNPDIRYEGGGFVSFKDKYNKKFGYPTSTSHNLKQISKDTRVSLKGLQQIYNKGIGAFKTNPSSVRPTVKSKEQWAMARVYSAVMGGKSSKIDSNELKMKNGGGIPDNYIYVVNNFGNGESLNKVFNEWKNIKSEKDHADWSMRVKLLRFGTYQQFTLLDVMEKFDFDKSDKINGILKRDFKKEVQSALKYRFDGGGDVEAGDWDNLEERGAADVTIKLNEFLRSNGLNTKVNLSKTSFGRSQYIYATDLTNEFPDESNAVKIRISDHSVSNFDRMFNEIHLDLKDTEYDESLGQYILAKVRFKIGRLRKEYFTHEIVTLPETKRVETTNLTDKDVIISESLTKKGKPLYKVDRTNYKRFNQYTYIPTGKIFSTIPVDEIEEKKKKERAELAELKERMDSDIEVKKFLRQKYEEGKVVRVLERTYDNLETFKRKHPDYEFIEQRDLGGGAYKYFFMREKDGNNQYSQYDPHYQLWLKENVINKNNEMKKESETFGGGGGVTAKSSHTLNSNKGKIAISLDKKWSDVNILLVPISFLAKCSEFNRRNEPKYSFEDSFKNIENIKKSFVKNGIIEPLIINYIKNESKFLLLEGNHRLNALIELEVPYYPVCVTVIDSWAKGKGKGVKTKVKPYMITEINKSKYLSVDNFEGVPYVNIENNHVDVNETDTLTINVPLLIRLFEYIREDVDNDAQIHFLTENLLKLKDKELSMADYDSIINGIKIKKTAEKILALGGLAEGPPHSEGGIPLVVKSTGQNIEIEGGELVVNKFSSSETEKFNFEGKDLTPCEIVSELNSMDNNGVEIDCNKILGRFKK